MTDLVCRRCGSLLAGDPTGPWCPRCSFEKALGGERSGDPEGDAPPDSRELRYETLHELGRGSMGVVWLARERSLDRLVALKVPAPGADPAWRARLLREGRAAASLRHPNIVSVHAMGGEGASAFLAMEFIECGGLDARIREGPIPFRESAALAARLAGALAYSHGAGLLHRDVKPSNILMGENGEPRLADFGLVGPLEGGGDLTIPGHIAGTPAYLAPEILGGSDKASAASDLYGLGAVLYACLTGRAPFLGESAAAILAQLPVADPPAPRLLVPGVPRDLETICLKCLEKSPGRRYGSASLLQADLEAFLDGRPIAARPVGFAGSLARSCRRHPALAISVGATILCLLALAIGGPLMALRLARAQASAEERLREALLARSRATRLASQIGQRNEALGAAAAAAKIRVGLDARDEAIAALARPEIVPIRSWPLDRVDEGVVTFDPDNDRYASENRLGALDLRRMSDNHLMQSWTGPSEKLWTNPSLSADGRLAVARNEKGEVLVWSVERPDPRVVLTDRPYVLVGRFRGYGQPDALSPDGRVLASALHDGGVSLNSTVDGKEIARIPTDTEATHVAFSGNGKFLAVGRGLLSRAGTVVAFIRIYDSSTWAETIRLPIDKGFQSIEWSPKSNLLLVTGGALNLFDTSSGHLLRSIDDPPAIRGYFGPFGTTLLSSTSGGSLTLWDLGSARPLLSGQLGSYAVMGVSRSGDLIANFAGESTSELVRLEMSGVVRTLSAGLDRDRQNVLSAAVSTVDFSPDGQWIATAIWGSLQLRGADGSLVASRRLGTFSNYCSVRFSRDGRSLLAGTAEEGLLRIPIATVDPTHVSLGEPEVLDKEFPEFITDISQDGKRALVTSLISGFVKVVPLDGAEGTGAVRWNLPGAAGAAFVNADQEVLANSLDAQGGAKLEVRDASSGSRIVRTLLYPHGAHVQVSADGSLVVLGTGEKGTVLLRGSDWSRRAALPADVQGRGVQCAISRDGRTLAFGVGIQTWLVDATDGSVLARLEGAQGGTYIPGLAFSPDGARLAVWWDNGELTVWDLRHLREELRSRGLDW